LKLTINYALTVKILLTVDTRNCYSVKRINSFIHSNIIILITMIIWIYKRQATDKTTYGGNRNRKNFVGCR